MTHQHGALTTYQAHGVTIRLYAAPGCEVSDAVLDAIDATLGRLVGTAAWPPLAAMQRDLGYAGTAFLGKPGGEPTLQLLLPGADGVAKPTRMAT